MKVNFSLALAGLAALASSSPCQAKPVTTNSTMLSHWPSAAATSLEAMIKRNAHTGAYAAFDMDNTSWRFDVEESLIPYLDNKGVLSRDKLDPSLKIIPFKDTATYKESLYSYYSRLCDIDAMVCYPWAAQVFSGMKLRELKGWVDELMTFEGGIINTTQWVGNAVQNVSVSRPIPFRAQQQLYNALMDNGISVYVVTASNEELVRMVASDPKYGYNVPPANVIGVTTLLSNASDPSNPTTARKAIEDGVYDPEAFLDLTITPYLWTPATWMSGKYGAILTYISQWRKAVLVAGDTPDSDGYMLFHDVDVAKGGVRLWINKKQSNMDQLQGMIANNTMEQASLGQEVTADKNWVIVKPEEIL
ncbi:hypothetical protein MCOR27_003265 [Pyricularia oryzae]|uniref:Phosphorylcholine phosphatase n=5 Tax=Pyricularia TaxID=48558 RepID=A0ABQ8NQ41_PYRGI|nr:phosphorylcholine phosphatase [Pyricularia oryzae 70-15]ELQ43509.1 phosphorylcholine phosphatase [Pyricularia oryzae Y34]KAH8836324.1 hypothetical protein MCOR01_011620 [Pyricularia oryzae]KAI6300505.1 hypothetical protein MCOR33_003779 [Pyricularia grisea]EHA55915.1 phosphorylcholine phosphatase [Pyricularia oryzae 70-15]KAH9439965.1 hypothetical protein MCOR02_003499 [Pyricularia oryzae]